MPKSKNDRRQPSDSTEWCSLSDAQPRYLGVQNAVPTSVTRDFDHVAHNQISSQRRHEPVPRQDEYVDDRLWLHWLMDSFLSMLSLLALLLIWLLIDSRCWMASSAGADLSMRSTLLEVESAWFASTANRPFSSFDSYRSVSDCRSIFLRLSGELPSFVSSVSRGRLAPTFTSVSARF